MKMAMVEESWHGWNLPSPDVVLLHENGYGRGKLAWMEFALPAIA
jgi:hypothetical protein